MKTIFVTCAALVTSLLVVGLAAQAGETEPSVEYISPFPVVMVPTEAVAGHVLAAEELAKAIGVQQISRAKVNPVCCIWVEITGWTPNPGQPGFIIINQHGGSIISATDLEQLKLAVERFKSSARKQNGEFQVPIGLMTNYQIVEPGRKQ